MTIDELLLETARSPIGTTTPVAPSLSDEAYNYLLQVTEDSHVRVIEDPEEGILLYRVDPRGRRHRYDILGVGQRMRILGAGHNSYPYKSAMSWARAAKRCFTSTVEDGYLVITRHPDDAGPAVRRGPKARHQDALDALAIHESLTWYNLPPTCSELQAVRRTMHRDPALFLIEREGGTYTITKLDPLSEDDIDFHRSTSPRKAWEPLRNLRPGKVVQTRQHQLFEPDFITGELVAQIRGTTVRCRSLTPKHPGELLLEVLP